MTSVTGTGTDYRLEKIRSLTELPSYEEVKDAVGRLQADEDEKFPSAWWKFCEDNRIYNAWNIEFVDVLAAEIKKFDVAPVIEICAGNGKLSYHLQRRGISIVLTSHSLGHVPGVENMWHFEALVKYNPQLVVGSWIPDSNTLTDTVLYRSVRYVIDIGHPELCALTEDVTKRPDIEITPMPSVQRYSICKSDRIGVKYNSQVNLVRRRA